MQHVRLSCDARSMNIGAFFAGVKSNTTHVCVTLSARASMDYLLERSVNGAYLSALYRRFF